jgi:integrase
VEETFLDRHGHHQHAAGAARRKEPRFLDLTAHAIRVNLVEYTGSLGSTCGPTNYSWLGLIENLGGGARSSNHTFRATGITAYLEGGGSIEHAQAIANHESPKTTKLYDRTGDQIDRDEIEKIRI